MIDIWSPKTDGHFINDFREKLFKKGFLKEDINVIVVNAKDALSKTIDPKNPHQNNETFNYMNILTEKNIYLPLIGFFIILIISYLIKKKYFKDNYFNEK